MMLLPVNQRVIFALRESLSINQVLVPMTQRIGALVVKTVLGAFPLRAAKPNLSSKNQYDQSLSSISAVSSTKCAASVRQRSKSAVRNTASQTIRRYCCRKPALRCRAWLSGVGFISKPEGSGTDESI